MIILFILLILIISFIIIHFVKSNRLEFVHGGIKKIKINEKHKDYMIDRQITKGREKIFFTINGEGNGLDFSQLRKILAQYSDRGISFIEKPVSDRVHYSIGSLGSGYKDKSGKYWDISPLFMKQHASIKNYLAGNRGIIGKNELYKTIKRLVPLGMKYIPPTYTIKEFESLMYNSGKLNMNNIHPPYILKHLYVSYQNGVKVIESKESYLQAKTDLNVNDNNAIISKYISNPILVDGKKFNLRVYFLLSVIHGITRCTAYDEYRIHTSKKKYINSDWLNPDIHISGGILTTKRYTWPDDIGINYDKEKIKTNLQKCIDVTCLVLSMSGMKNYEETDAGYQVYGADILITDDYKIYILEINRRPGFKILGEQEGWEEYNKKFSYNFFSFILKHTVFPHLGIARQPSETAEFIGNGILSKYANILTGKNRYTLIPDIDATNTEIKEAKKFNFYNKIYPLDHFISNGDQFFLISCKSGSIVGYIVLCNKDVLTNTEYGKTIKIAIIKEYQNRSIATAMIAQLLEILSAIAYVDHKNPKIYIKNINKYLTNIAIKLFFTKKDNYYERVVKYKDNSKKKYI